MTNARESVDGRPNVYLKTDPARSILEILTVLGVLYFIALIGRTNDYQLAGAVGILTAVIIVGELLRQKGSSWREFGLVKPESLRKTLLGALIAYVAMVVTVIPVGSLIVSILGETPDISGFDNIRANLPALLFWILLSWLVAGFGEELIFRGFVMNRLAQVFGGSRSAWAGALVIQAVIFGFGHSYQGTVGIIVTGVTGLVMGAIYLIAKRRLWIPIIVHGLNDTIGFTLLYFGLVPTG